MKLTAKLLKKIIREAIGSVPGPYGGVRGIGKFYSDEKGKLDPESARQAVDLSSILAMDPDDEAGEEEEKFVTDLETEDLDETIFIEVKEIIADFIDQYYQNFLERVNEAEGGDNYPDEFDPIPGVRQKVDAIINKIYFTQPESQIRALVDAIKRSVPYRRNMFKISRLSSREEKKAERLLLKQFIGELEKLNDFFKSYDDLLAALSPESQKVLKSLSIEDKINDRIQKHAQTVKASQAIKVRPISDYQNMIRLAKTREEVATIFNVFKAHMVGLRKFMGDYMTSHYGYSSMFIAPRELIIDPEKIKTVHHEKDYSWTENAPRKAIDYLDNRDQEKPIGKIMNEIESYISDAISGEFVGRYTHPKVKQGFMPKKFPMSEAILKKLIYEELSSLMSEQEEEIKNVTLEDIGLPNEGKIKGEHMVIGKKSLNIENAKQYLSLAQAFLPIYIDIEDLVDKSVLKCSDVFNFQWFFKRRLASAISDFYYDLNLSLSRKKEDLYKYQMSIAYKEPLDLLKQWDGSKESFMKFYNSFIETARSYAHLPNKFAGDDNFPYGQHESGMSIDRLRAFSKKVLDKENNEHPKQQVKFYIFIPFGILNDDHYRKHRDFDKGWENILNVLEKIVVYKAYRYVKDMFARSGGEPPDFKGKLPM